MLSTDGGCVVTGIWIQPSDVVMVVAASSVEQHYDDSGVLELLNHVVSFACYVSEGSTASVFRAN